MTIDGASVGSPKDFVSVIIPCRNESGRIVPALESVLNNDWPRTQMEIVIADGMSDDGTREELAQFAAQFPDLICIIDNPDRVVPAALNRCIDVAKGNYIVRLDAHSRYPANYISTLIGGLKAYRADNIGGVFAAHPADGSLVSETIADAVSHPFGIGGSHHRIVLDGPRETDTVPYGCFKKLIFGEVGGFDEDMLRNEDEEFNGRLLKAGKKIVILPHVMIEYYARKSLRDTWTMFYQYGHYKPLVLKKLGKLVSVRQLVPPLFVLYLVAIVSITGISRSVLWPLFLPLAAYLLVNGLVCLRQQRLRSKGGNYGVVLFVTFLTIHVSYGIGYLRGVLDFLIMGRERRLKGKDYAVSRSK